MTIDELMTWIERHGVVLESAHGPVPDVASHIAGGPIRGSWWTHRESREIFRLTRAIRDSKDILACRLVDGKITFVHRRLWPALIRLADRFPRASLARLTEVHTKDGKHVVKKVPFPRWVPGEVIRKAERMSEKAAEKQLEKLVQPAPPTA